MEKGLAIITGADGGMGQVITAALAKEGYPVIMACHDPEKAVPVCTRIRQETGNTQIEVRRIDLASLSSVNNFTGQLLKEGRPVSLLMNNAGILTTPVRNSNTKLALLLFTQEFAERLQDKDITINASDPGIVSTNMITMQAWFDPLTDILFRPFIKTPAQGAATAIHLASCTAKTTLGRYGNLAPAKRNPVLNRHALLVSYR